MCKDKKDHETKRERTDDEQKRKKIKRNPYAWIEKRFMERR